MRTDLELFCCSRSASVSDVMKMFERNQMGIVLLVDANGHLLGTITDGDIRRAYLRTGSFDIQAGELLDEKIYNKKIEPVVARQGAPIAEILKIMQEGRIHQVPILDVEERVCGVVTMDHLLPKSILPVEAVIMAGGKGLRMRPLTNDIPKPMLPIGEKPMLQRTIEMLRHYGITNIHLSTNYLHEKILEHFGSGEEFGVDIKYVKEGAPLGTAGSLASIAHPIGPVLVMNGDVLTAVDIRAMLEFHREHEAKMTIGVKKYDIEIPYGVVESDGIAVSGIKEKPLVEFFVNAGVYLLEPEVLSYLERDKKIDMTDLIGILVDKKQLVTNFPIMEYWLDIGKPDHYQQAQDDVMRGVFSGQKND